MDSNQSVSLSQTQQTPPPPPPPVAPVTEEDQDEVFSSKSVKTSSSGGDEIDSSSSSVSSFASEEAFLSGDDEFETASERPFVADEENLELDMGEGEDMVVTGGGVDDEIDLGPLNFPPLVPSSLASGGGNEVVGSEVGGGGVEVENDGVEVGKVRVLEGEVGELGVKERELGGSSIIGDGVLGDDGVDVNDDVKMVGDDSLVVNPENGVLGFEEKGVSLVENPVSDKVSTDVHGDVSEDKEDILDKNLKLNEVLNPVVLSGEEEVAEVKDGAVEDKKSDIPELVESVGNEAIAEVEGFSEASAEKKDDVLPDNSKLGEVVNPESQEKETTELKDGVVEEEKSETVDLGVELAEDKVVGVTEGSVVAVEEGSVLPEKLKQEEVVNPVNGNQEEETTVLEDGVVEEEMKSESLDSGLIEAVGDKAPVITEGSSELEISKLSKERKSEILDAGSIEVVEDKVPVVDEDSSKLEVSNLTAVVDPAISSQEEEKIKLKDSAVQDEKDEVLGGELTANSMLGEDSVTDTKQCIEVSEHVDSDVNKVELPIEKGATLASRGKRGENVVEELTYSKVVEVDNEVNLTKGDSDVETKQPITSEVEANGIGGIQEKIISETPVLAVDRSADVGIVSDQVPAAVEESKDPKFVEAETGFEKVEHNKSETELGNVETADELNGSGSAESASVHPDGKPELEAAPEIDSGANLSESKSELAAEGVEYEAPDAVTCTKSEDLKTAPEIDSETNLTKPKAKVPDGAAQEIPAAVTCTKSEELKTDPEIDSGPNLTEPKSELAADGVEHEAPDAEELNTVLEDKAQIPVTESDDANIPAEVDGSEDVISVTSRMPESLSPTKTMDQEAIEEAEEEVNLHPEYEEDEGSASDEDNEGLMFDGSEAARRIMKELMQGSVVNSRSAAQDSQDDSERIDGQIIAESDEEIETDEEDDGKELFDSAALSALLKAATGGGSEGGTVTITSPDGSRLFSVERPAGLGSSVRPLRPAPRPTRPNIFTPSDLTVGGASENNLSEEEKKKLEKIQLIRVKYLRLIHRLGHSPDDSIAAQVLYRLVLTAGRNTSEAFSLETAKKTAMQLESEGKDDLDFCLNILVLGKTGVGKSATINSIFGEEKTTIDAFQPATTTVKEIVGTVGGVKIRVFDTPGLRSSAMEQAFNRKILSSVKKATKKCPPDILLYVDRLDTQTRDLNDMPLLRSITNTLGSSIWRSAVVTLTHGASAPPDGPSGNPLSYEVFVAQRSHVVQQSIGQAVGDLRMMNPSLMNPVTLVENHPSCRKNREGQKILPNGQSWRPQLLLLSYSLKILSEVNSLSKPQDPIDHRKLFGFRVRSPPLPYLLSTLLQSRTHPKLPTDQGGENADSDIELEGLSDSDQEDEEDEYDQLPPFKPLRKAQIAKLSKEQRKAYFDEYDYRVKLLQKKQWKEELRRMKEMKNGKNDTDFMGEDADPEGGAAAPVPVPLPDMVLPPSFDGDNPAYRYRFLEPTSQLLARPVLDTHGWDHDCGYDGVSLEENLAIAGRFPAVVAVQVTKDKKEFNIHLDSSVAAKHGENGSTLAGFDIQTIGKHLAYVFRGETKFKKLKRNKMAGGISVTFLGESVATGLKFEDQVSIGKRVTLVGSTGTVRSQGDAAYGANLEARLKEKDFPIGQDQSTLGLSLMKWRGDLALGANLQSQFSIGRSSKLSVRVGLNNKLSGQITVRISSSEQLQLALVGILPIALSIYHTIWPETGESYSAY